jgi:hypothetical protein
MRAAIAFLLLGTACGPDPSTLQAALPGGSGLPENCRTLEAPPAIGVIACSGAFEPGGAARLCPAGYQLATGMMPESARNGCEQNYDLIVQGQSFAVDVPVWADNAMPLGKGSCAQGTPTQWIGLMICGGDYTGLLQTVKCQSWPRAVVFGKSAAWSGAAPSLAAARNTDPKNGVVCSKTP